MNRLAAGFTICILAVSFGCRAKQPVVLHVYRDRTSPIGRELDRRFYELSAKKISLSSGREIVIATVEPQDYKQMLHDKIGSQLLPELIVLNSPADEEVNPIIQREARHAVDICTAVRACPAFVPAFIPSWVSSTEELQAAQQVLNALRERKGEQTRSADN
jgi:hypothetical protein